MTTVVKDLKRIIGNNIFAKASDYLALAKPRVMYLAIFTAFVGIIIAPGHLPPSQTMLTIIAIALGAASAGALNMWYDADIDSIMSRTNERPIPSGRVSSKGALLFGLITSLLSILLLAAVTNMAAACLLAFTIFFYAVIYTMWLKFLTPHNIVIGGAAGALPPLIGWTAVTGTVSLQSTTLFLIIFLWTPPHFWALALFRSRDYEDAGIPMMPVIAGGRSTRKQIFVYSLALAPSGLMPWFMGPASAFYACFAALLGAVFVWKAWNVLTICSDDQSFRSEKQLFIYSIKYLFLVFSALLIDKLIFHILWPLLP